MKKDIILLGGGGHCRSCIDVIENQNLYRIVGILDLVDLIGNKISGYEIIGSDDDLFKIIKTIKNFHISIGQIKSSAKRVELYNLIKSFNAQLPVIISPFAYISKLSNIGEGSIIMHHALVNANASVGRNCIINSKALIEHDAVVQDHCHIATAAIINGGVKVGEGCFIGSNSVTKQNISIPDNSFVKANSLTIG